MDGRLNRGTILKFFRCSGMLPNFMKFKETWQKAKMSFVIGLSLFVY